MNSKARLFYLNHFDINVHCEIAEEDQAKMVTFSHPKNKQGGSAAKQRQEHQISGGAIWPRSWV